jgi:ATP-dependent protease ClpP protease subunit
VDLRVWQGVNAVRVRRLRGATSVSAPTQAKPAPRKNIASLERDWYEADIERIKGEVEAKNLELKLTRSKPVASGEFMVCGTICDELVYPTIHNLHTWSNAHPGEPITIVLDTDGGSVFAGFSLYDFIQRLRRRGHHVTMVGVGMAASMGSILLQAGDERVMSKRCWMLIHEVQGVVGGSVGEMDAQVKHNKRLQAQALDILGERSGKRQWIQRNWADDKLWLSAEDALEKGFRSRPVARTGRRT